MSASKKVFTVHAIPNATSLERKTPFFALHTAMGQRRLLAQKADRLGVSISYDWLLGLSLGFEKPYYLEMIDDKDGG